MKRLYQQTFDHISMPEDKARALRAELVSRSSQTKTEVVSMKKQRMLLIAVAVIAALSLSAFAGGYHVVYRLLSGGDAPVENGVNLTDLPADFEQDGYHYTEENGGIVVTLD